MRALVTVERRPRRDNPLGREPVGQLGEEEESTMPKSRPPYPAAFRQQKLKVGEAGAPSPLEISRAIVADHACTGAARFPHSHSGYRR